MEPLDKQREGCHNEANPIIRAWIGQLLRSEELASVLEDFGQHRIDVTLSASNGKAVLKPKITFRQS